MLPPVLLPDEGVIELLKKKHATVQNRVNEMLSPRPTIVVDGAKIRCAHGSATCKLKVLPNKFNSFGAHPLANILDMIPVTNIGSFGMCNSMFNPVVAAATAAASGVLTPQPCSPPMFTPWAPGSLYWLIKGAPALTLSSYCMCMWAAKVTVVDPGQSHIWG
jgi:hypothetical protein